MNGIRITVQDVKGADYGTLLASLFGKGARKLSVGSEWQIANVQFENKNRAVYISGKGRLSFVNVPDEIASKFWAEVEKEVTREKLNNETIDHEQRDRMGI